MPAWETWGVELWTWLCALALCGALAALGAVGLLAPSCLRSSASHAGWRASLLFGIFLLAGIGGVCWQVWQGGDVAPLAAPFDLNVVDEEFQRRQFPEGAIRTAPPDLAYNCHGWTFANGACSLTDADVWEKLNSTAWDMVCDPSPGDVIVYLGAGGGIKHTGIVRALDERGQIWVESKWGQLGRYVHHANLANYIAEHAFFRPAAATMAE